MPTCRCDGSWLPSTGVDVCHAFGGGGGGRRRRTRKGRRGGGAPPRRVPSRIGVATPPGWAGGKEGEGAGENFYRALLSLSEEKVVFFRNHTSHVGQNHTFSHAGQTTHPQRDRTTPPPRDKPHLPCGTNHTSPAGQTRGTASPAGQAYQTALRDVTIRAPREHPTRCGEERGRKMDQRDEQAPEGAMCAVEGETRVAVIPRF